MKKNKGFTLIELLAVIVILAIIALIATPMILNVVQDAKKSAAVASANGFIEAVENNNMLAEFDADGSDYSYIAAGLYEVDAAAITGVPLKGDIPSDGWIVLSSEGMITAAVLYFDDIAAGSTVIYESDQDIATIDYDVADMAAPADALDATVSARLTEIRA